MTFEHFKGICLKCSQRKRCNRPCIFIERMISEENKVPFEKDAKDNLKILFPERKFVLRESDLNFFKDDSGYDGNQIFFSTENPILEDLFNNEDFTPRLKQTGIFVDKFFFRMSNKELAKKYKTTSGGVSKMYTNAKERMIKSIKAMDKAEYALSNGKKLAVMPRGVHVFLLHTLLNLPVTEIARFLDIGHSAVIGHIRRTKERIRSGEVNLLQQVR